MKIMAMEKEIPGVSPDEFAQHLKSEARQVWKLYQEGCLRELYFREDRSEAVLILECADRDEAKQVLDSLPLVKAGLISFELIPLLPYPGFSRLFVEN
jgi:hypothetical protein